MKKIILTLVVLATVAGTSIYGMKNSPVSDEVTASVPTVKDYTALLTVKSLHATIYEDETTVTVTNNGSTVDFDMQITLLGFFTGNVHITGIKIVGTNIEAGSTGSVTINGQQYTVVFGASTITDTACNLNLTVNSTPIGNLRITFN